MNRDQLQKGNAIVAEINEFNEAIKLLNENVNTWKKIEIVRATPDVPAQLVADGVVVLEPTDGTLKLLYNSIGAILDNGIKISEQALAQL